MFKDIQNNTAQHTTPQYNIMSVYVYDYKLCLLNILLNKIQNYEPGLIKNIIYFVEGCPLKRFINTLKRMELNNQTLFEITKKPITELVFNKYFMFKTLKTQIAALNQINASDIFILNIKPNIQNKKVVQNYYSSISNSIITNKYYYNIWYEFIIDTSINKTYVLVISETVHYCYFGEYEEYNKHVLSNIVRTHPFNKFHYMDKIKYIHHPTKFNDNHYKLLENIRQNTTLFLQVD